VADKKLAGTAHRVKALLSEQAVVSAASSARSAFTSGAEALRAFAHESLREARAEARTLEDMKRTAGKAIDVVSREQPEAVDEVQRLMSMAELDQLRVTKAELREAKHDQAMAKGFEQQRQQTLGRSDVSNARRDRARGAAELHSLAHEQAREAHAEVQTFEAMKKAAGTVMDFVSKEEPDKANFVKRLLSIAERDQLHIAKSELQEAKHDQVVASDLNRQKHQMMNQREKLQESLTDVSQQAGVATISQTVSDVHQTVVAGAAALRNLAHEQAHEAHAEVQTVEAMKTAAGEASAGDQVEITQSVAQAEKIEHEIGIVEHMVAKDLRGSPSELHATEALLEQASTAASRGAAAARELSIQRLREKASLHGSIEGVPQGLSGSAHVADKKLAGTAHRVKALLSEQAVVSAASSARSAFTSGAEALRAFAHESLREARAEARTLEDMKRTAGKAIDVVSREQPEAVDEVQRLMSMAELDQLRVTKAELREAKHDQAMAKGFEQQRQQTLGRSDVSNARRDRARGAAELHSLAHEQAREAHAEVQTFEAMKKAAGTVMDFVSKEEPDKANFVKRLLSIAERDQLHIAKSELQEAKHDQVVASDLNRQKHQMMNQRERIQESLTDVNQQEAEHDNVVARVLKQQKRHVLELGAVSKGLQSSGVAIVARAGSDARATFTSGAAELRTLTHQEFHEAHAEVQTLEALKTTAGRVMKLAGTEKENELERLLGIAEHDQLHIAKTELQSAEHDEAMLKGLQRKGHHTIKLADEIHHDAALVEQLTHVSDSHGYNKIIQTSKADVASILPAVSTKGDAHQQVQVEEAARKEHTIEGMKHAELMEANQNQHKTQQALIAESARKRAAAGMTDHAQARSNSQASVGATSDSSGTLASTSSGTSAMAWRNLAHMEVREADAEVGFLEAMKQTAGKVMDFVNKEDPKKGKEMKLLLRGAELDMLRIAKSEVHAAEHDQAMSKALRQYHPEIGEALHAHPRKLPVSAAAKKPRAAQSKVAKKADSSEVPSSFHPTATRFVHVATNRMEKLDSRLRGLTTIVRDRQKVLSDVEEAKTSWTKALIGSPAAAKVYDELTEVEKDVNAAYFTARKSKGDTEKAISKLEQHFSNRLHQRK